MVKIYNYNSDGREMKITIGKVAEQANGACLVQAGETVVLVTATASKEPRQGIDFFPLSCDFEEKMYSVGKFPGGFIKREGRPSEGATLAARQIDRPLRPLFPEGFRNDVQIIATVLSKDPDNDPAILAMVGSSIALSISNIPFKGPTGSVSIGFVDGQVVINPNEEQRKVSDLDLTVSGTKEAIMMVEAGCNMLTEAQVLESILTAHEEIKKICEFIEGIVAEIGEEKTEFAPPEFDQELKKDVEDFAKDKLIAAIRNENKMARQDDQSRISAETEEFFKDRYPEREREINQVLEDITVKEVRRLIIEDKIRPDGRKVDEIRSIACETGLLPRAHGSGLFSRGQTQVLTVATLGSPSDVQIIDGLNEKEIKKRYVHQYNFPPYSVGETRPMRSPGRREIGHGALAERALIPVLPTEGEFPYTLRLVSEVLSSNGSSSQASVCGSTLALMDAGVPIKAPVAGIAMGLVKEEGEEELTILTDIQGLEDHFGDMDFKVAGTKDGITALQMDIKITGIDRAVLEEALERARIARLSILDKMEACIDAPRDHLSKYAPRIFSIDIDPEKVREVIGPGGKVINRIIDETGVAIDTEDDGHITVTASSDEAGLKAIQMIQDIVKEIEVGEIYTGKVARIMKFGAFVEIAKGKEGMVHISQLANERVEKVEDVINIGDEITVKVIEIDSQGRVNLSRKALLPKDPNAPERDNKHHSKPRSDHRDRRDHRGNKGGTPPFKKED